MKLLKTVPASSGRIVDFVVFFSLFLLALNIDMQDVGKKFVTQLT